jgi:hypothetical protein
MFMAKENPNQLPQLHEIIVEIVKCNPGLFTRSELAKFLVGSESTRVMEYHHLPGFAILKDSQRKALTFEIDILLQQKFLALDSHSRIVLG